MLSWFVKTIRSGARAADGSLPADVWTEGVVHPTLNLFDVGDTRAVTLVIHWKPIDEGVVGPLTTGMDSPRGSETSDSKHLVIGEEVPTYPIDTRNALRDPDKKDAMNRQGLGVGEDGDPSPTLTSLFVPAVISTEEAEVSSVFPIQNTVIGRKDTAGPQGRGHGDADGPMFTLDTGGGHAVAVAEEEKNLEPAAYDEFNDSISPVHHTLRAGTKQSTGVFASVVRRLTPVECERLQGFPDDWTMADAKTVDSHRYKQMGNAVTVNVIGWIGSRL